MRTLLALVPALLLAACGLPAPKDRVVVRSYTYYRGDVTTSTDNLGFTYGPVDGEGALYEGPGFNCLINPIMLDSPDDDLMVRVIIHELANVCVLLDGAWPEAMDPTWYVWEGDSQPYHYEVTPAEGTWFAQHGPLYVTVGDAWLFQPTLEAIGRVNGAAGVEVFVAEFDS